MIPYNFKIVSLFLILREITYKIYQILEFILELQFILFLSILDQFF